MGAVSLFYSFQCVSAIVTNDELPHAVIQISPVETHVRGQSVMVTEIRPTLRQMHDIRKNTRNEAQRAIIDGAIQSLTAAMK